MIPTATVLILSITQFGLCDKFISRQLNRGEIQDALALAESVRPNFAKLTRDPVFTLPATLTSEEQWYSPVDVSKPRFDALAQLIIVPFMERKLEGSEKLADGKILRTTSFKFAGSTVRGATCSAFYVASAIIATAAHCLRDSNVTPSSNHVIIVRQQSDGSKEFTNALAKKFERVVVEWIYPGELEQLPADRAWHALNGFNYAYARVNAENEGKAFYKLISPDDLGATPHPALLMVGYPRDAGRQSKAVSVSCKLAKVGDDLAKKDKGVRRALPGKDANVIQGNQLLCLGEKGNMQAGGTGGPWLLDETALVGDAAKADKERWAVGVTGWTYDRGEVKAKRDSHEYKAAFTEEQSFCTATSGAWIKPLHLNQLEALKKAPATKTWKQVLEEV